jgi:hypothetical protein
MSFLLERYKVFTSCSRGMCCIYVRHCVCWLRVTCTCIVSGADVVYTCCTICFARQAYLC